MSLKKWMMLMAVSLIALAIGFAASIEFLIFFGIGGAVVSSFFKLVFMYKDKTE